MKAGKSEPRGLCPQCGKRGLGKTKVCTAPHPLGGLVWWHGRDCRYCGHNVEVTTREFK